MWPRRIIYGKPDTEKNPSSNKSFIKFIGNTLKVYYFGINQCKEPLENLLTLTKTNKTSFKYVIQVTKALQYVHKSNIFEWVIPKRHTVYKILQKKKQNKTNRRYKSSQYGKK